MILKTLKEEIVAHNLESIFSQHSLGSLPPLDPPLRSLSGGGVIISPRAGNLSKVTGGQTQLRFHGGHLDSQRVRRFQSRSGSSARCFPRRLFLWSLDGYSGEERLAVLCVQNPGKLVN